jgi:hypothetical protein
MFPASLKLRATVFMTSLTRTMQRLEIFAKTR